MGQLLFKKVFWDAIRAGRKRTTVRRWDRPRVSAGSRAYAPGLGWLSVERVDEIADLRRLSEADAVADGFETVKDMIEALVSLYPDHASDGKRWFRVAFRAEELVAEGESSRSRDVGLFGAGVGVSDARSPRRKRRR